jgi:general secretion pathway protein G
VAKKRESRVFFPWERRRVAWFSRRRARVVAGVVAVVAVLLWIRSREEHAASVRATRATITSATRAVSAYRADHQGACPKDIPALVAAGYARDTLVDAWGRPLRLACPGRRDPQGFEISSDGPDGIPGGLDRVE